MLEERKRRILETYETDTVQKQAQRQHQEGRVKHPDRKQPERPRSKRQMKKVPKKGSQRVSIAVVDFIGRGNEMPERAERDVTQVVRKTR